jgi:nicotinamide-nucleotide amidase
VTRAEQVVAAYISRNWALATAESCTGGMLAAAITDIAGSSAVLERGFVTYSNAAKAELLAVSAALIAACGAVSKEVAVAMAQGAIAASHADIAIAVTGIAGPSGGSTDKPVGLVHFAWTRRGGHPHHLERRFGNPGRAAIRQLAVDQALQLLLDAAA